MVVGDRGLYADRPPLAHTGGFGEPTCAACHNQFEPSAEGLLVGGLPAGYEPGQSYSLTLTLTDDLMELAGFQAAIRFAEGERAGAQAGSLAPASTHGEATDSAGVTYVHTPSGGLPTPEGQVSWTLHWSAPEGGGRVVLHAVANEANGDSSPLSDLVYTARAESFGR